MKLLSLVYVLNTIVFTEYFSGDAFQFNMTNALTPKHRTTTAYCILCIIIARL